MKQQHSDRPPGSRTPSHRLAVYGAREHNLKDISIEMPRDSLVVITGLSGSGKSSLAFDTIYAEGQRRYVESLSAYARQFLEMMQKPDVDYIEGLSPAISIEQKTTSRNPRSTVGTVTEIYDYMRLLWARIGVPYSPATGKPISAQTVSEMVDRIVDMGEGTRLYLLAPIVRGRKGEYRKEIAELRAKGFQRLKIDGTIYEIDELPSLDKKRKHDIAVVVDRLVVRADIQTRLADSIETALSMADGLLIAEDADTGGETVFSEKFACPVSGFTLEEIEPRLFSFNNPQGACPSCDGLGSRFYFDEDLIVPDKSKSLKGGAIEPWSKNFSGYYMQALEAVAKHCGVSMVTPFMDLDPKVQKVILHGSGQEKISFEYADGIRSFKTKKVFEGVVGNLARRMLETESQNVRDELSRFQSTAECDECNGYRLKAEALSVKVNGLHIGQVKEMSIDEAANWFRSLPATLGEQSSTIAGRILKEIEERLTFLSNVGLNYLTLNRASGTLSGGESQRIRLASQIGSGLTGVLYVLDEPSIGLHQRDNHRLLKTLKRLRDLGNTVIVVEHDEDAIREADHIIDMGPGAGIYGGEVVVAGTIDDIRQHPDSLTGQYLSGRRAVPLPHGRRRAKGGEETKSAGSTDKKTGKTRKKVKSAQTTPASSREKSSSLARGQWLEISGCSGNNLKNVNAQVPIGTLCCVTGVSGSGKSTLIIETLYKAAARKLMRSRQIPAPCEGISGLEHIDKIIDIDQSPIGRTPRSNPATYTGAFTPIREWFAGLPESKARGYGPGRFSFNVKGGRCEACQGDGVIKIEMHFLPDVYVTCDTCKGKRYNRETLEVKYKDKTIAGILDMSIEEAAVFFKAVPAIRDKMETLKSVGLGYIKIGQPATTLSGGEAQRVKLSKELSRRSTGQTLYILDEPTTGLHFEDIRQLLEVLHRLVDQGNTVVVIEHNLDVIKTADWIIDMGPEGGTGGGEVVATGTPEEVAACPESHTGKFLLPLLSNQEESPHRTAQVGA